MRLLTRVSSSLLGGRGGGRHRGCRGGSRTNDDSAILLTTQN